MALRDSILALAPADDRALLQSPAPISTVPARLICVDHDFAAWPFDEPAVLQALTTWLRGPGRRLVLIGMDYERTALRLPRFARWRRDHDHRMDVWRPTESGVPEALRGLLVGAVAWRWLETNDAQLLRLTDPVHRQAFKTEIADFLQRCEPAWPATTLGL